MPETNRQENVPQNLHEASELTGGGDKRQEIFTYTEWAKKFLERTLGISDLSALEGVHLRNTVETLLPKLKNERQLVNEGEMSHMHLAEMEEEAAALWLYNVYGIHQKDIPWVHIIEDLTTGKKYKYEKTETDIIGRKVDELMAKGHELDDEVKVPDDFKEHLKKIREKFHHQE